MKVKLTIEQAICTSFILKFDDIADSFVFNTQFEYFNKYGIKTTY